MNNILESRIIYKDGKIEEIFVLVDFTSSNSKPLSDVRTIHANNKPKGGYMWIEPQHKLSDELLQSVASYGMETNKKIFNKL
jgi:hypothetical protein